MVDVSQDSLAGHGDDFYETLMAAHHGLNANESARLNARLVLIMANAIGDIDQLKAIILAARSHD
jgi:hypothetical protein